MSGDNGERFGEQLRRRTKTFAIDVPHLCRALPRADEGRVIGWQLLRSAMSVGANYRAVSRARSKAEFVSKLAVVVEEADESLFWLEILSETGIVGRDRDGKTEARGERARFDPDRLTKNREGAGGEMTLQFSIHNTQLRIR